MGNYLARFLGGLGLATAPGYPVFENLNCQLKEISVKAMIYWDMQN
jgi:hypothetical protein